MENVSWIKILLEVSKIIVDVAIIYVLWKMLKALREKNEK